ncbi:homoserine kinase [Methanocella arvoryzae]|uniref:Homoserine kinase n=1 Tax=Methanocella arvoryzae (strain DSM 22066 / NBRC 105507 / MRE50) TaxID=351160 RepID=KHSE_METAR|nr:homoserine kinase [Methanocella arvoryzae]Q0W2X4.1 RecName: Full=Homoserine kinase; Short=HK; Short=HSK [Methanocella arvoryzae MRE50]CAJ37269.1 homoserine kinase [Methanocella arvoryzae MRE50]
MDSITVKASATSANLGAGFDVMGIALESPGDIIRVEKADELSIVVKGRGAEGIPADPEKNTAGLVALAMDKKVRITIKSGIRPGSGLGSSAAPAAGTAVAINELFSLGYSKEELVWIAARGEMAAAGIVHADNVAPCIMGGLTLVCNNYVEHVELPPMGVVAVLPEIVVSTKSARGILPQQVPLQEMVLNVSKAAMLMAGVVKKDPVIIGRSLSDTFNEKYRSPLIKGYGSVREAALDSGAYGVAISGSGPTMLALCPEDRSFDVAAAMRKKFEEAGVVSEAYVTCIGKGVRIINRDEEE